MTLVRSLEELEGNVRQLSAYLNSPIEIERSDNGAMIISSKVGAEDVAALRLRGRLRKVLTQDQKSYLAFHRKHVFIG